jgi:hypothetical protein
MVVRSSEPMGGQDQGRGAAFSGLGIEMRYYKTTAPDICSYFELLKHFYSFNE